MKKIVVSALVLMLTGTTVCPLPSLAQMSFKDAALDESTLMDGAIHVPNGSKTVSVSVNDDSIRTVLHDLSVQGGFNLIMDESVTGNVTVELSNVTLNMALQSVAALGDILILKQKGNIYMAISRTAAQDKGVARQLSKVVKINYSNASRIADILNQSLFASSSGASGGSGGASAGGGAAAAGGGGATAGGTPTKVTSDPRTNSLVIVGTEHEIELAEAAINKLDIPRQSKTFYLSHANAVDVATQLSSSIYNDGNPAFRLGGGGAAASGSSGGGAAAGNTSSLRVERQDITDGSGINTFGSSSSGGGSATAGLSSAVTLRGFAKTSDTATISADGPLIIPDSRQNAITIMGTAEQIALAESFIPTLDAQVPQVSIEASLIEITDTGTKELATRWGISDGQMQSGFNNLPLAGTRNSSGATVATGTGLVGMQTVDATDTSSFARSGMVFTTNPFSRETDYLLQLRTLIGKNKAKILANPTVVAAHDTESIISIVDEIVRRVTTQIDPSGFSTQTVEIGEAGIVMDILPKIGEDGTINMRLRPSVTSILSQTRDSQGNIITLLSRRDMLTQSVRIRDGETLVLGGLIQQRETSRTDKLPIGGDLPIVGAMFRASQGSNRRSELVMLITPHIINNTKITPVNTLSTGNLIQNSLAGGQ